MLNKQTEHADHTAGVHVVLFLRGIVRIVYDMWLPISSHYYYLRFGLMQVTVNKLTFLHIIMIFNDHKRLHGRHGDRWGSEKQSKTKKKKKTSARQAAPSSSRFSIFFFFAFCITHATWFSDNAAVDRRSMFSLACDKVFYDFHSVTRCDSFATKNR